VSAPVTSVTVAVVSRRLHWLARHQEWDTDDRTLLTVPCRNAIVRYPSRTACT
jgi:hypothetical protein